ncbi:MAG TPA: carboxypeptidase-like regulatory domain-containing protein [Allosphingosinicella sp.]|uniref:MSCRAMM family protein n=1 Tax=Allosphingosinicella sp. TaxID=2823234 RepID=UPI002ED99631
MRFASLFRYVLGYALALTAVFGIALPAAAEVRSLPWKPNDDDALLLEVRLKQYILGQGVRGYQTPEGVCVDLGDTLLTLDVPVKPAYRDGVAAGWAFREDNRIEINRLLGRVRHGVKESRLTDASIRDTNDGWCVSARELSNWLGINLRVDIRNALLVIETPSKLPVELAAERKARAAKIRPPPDAGNIASQSAPYQLWRPPSLDAVISVGGLRDSKRGGRLDRRYELYASGELLHASLDARLASDRKGMPSSLRVRSHRIDNEGKLLGPLKATYAAAGDVAGLDSPLVGQSVPGRGAVVTNRPLDRPESFDRTTLRGELPEGWDAELYRNGQLLAVSRDRRDGRYEFADVQLLYGQNQLEVVLYGPQGQVRRRQEVVSVGQESIAAGKTYYWAGISQDFHDLINISSHPERKRRGWRGALGLEHGLDARTSLGAQLHSLVIDNERLNFAEMALRRSLGPALLEMSGSVEDSGGYALRSQLLAQFGRTYLSGESVFARNFYSDRMEREVRGRHSIAVDRAFTVGRSVIPAHVEARYVQRTNSPDTLEAGARLSSNIRGWSLTGAVDWRQQRSSFGSASKLEAALLANGNIGEVRVRGETKWRLRPDTSFESAGIVGQWTASERSDWRGELAYDRKLSRGRGGVGWVRRFDSFAMALTGEAATDGSVAANLNLAFSLGPDPRRGGIRVTSSKLASRGTAVARVFRDLNNDGIRQPNEPAEKNVQLTAGRVPVTKLTGADGVVIVDDLTPYRPVNIGVDSTSLADPLLQPRKAILRVTPRPGVATELDIAIVGSGEVEGTLIRNGGGALEGVDIELVDRSGQVAAVTRSEFDGYFLFEAVPYGEYRLRIAKLSADALGLDANLGKVAVVREGAASVRLGSVAAIYERGASMAGGAAQ